MRCRPAILFLLLAVPVSLVQGQEKIRYQRSVSQTSVWPGDRLEYRIALYVPSEVRIAIEDFQERSVNFEPFLLLGKSLEQEELAAGQVRYLIRYQLVNLEIGDQQLEIPRLVFRYEDRTVSSEAGPSTQEMQIPPFPISVRTTLNAPIEQSWIRETLSSSQTFRYPWWLIILGLAGVVVGSLPLAGWLWRQLPRWKARKHRMGRREFLKQWKSTLQQVESQLGEDGAVKEQFGELDRLVRSYISHFWNVEAAGLTHGELAARLGEEGSLDSIAETLVRVLEHGEKCRYGPPNGDQWRTLLQQDLQKLKQVKMGRRG